MSGLESDTIGGFNSILAKQKKNEGEAFVTTVLFNNSVTRNIDDIIKRGEEADIKPSDEKELQTTLPYLTNQLKALVARDLWDMNEYYQIMNETNDIVVKALEVLKQP